MHSQRGVIDVFTDDAIYVVKSEPSTPNAHSAIRRLMTVRLATPKRRLVIACRRVTARRRALQGIKALEIGIVAIDRTLPTRE